MNAPPLPRLLGPLRADQSIAKWPSTLTQNSGRHGGRRGGAPQRAAKEVRRSDGRAAPAARSLLRMAFPSTIKCRPAPCSVSAHPPPPTCRRRLPTDARCGPAPSAPLSSFDRVKSYEGKLATLTAISSALQSENEGLRQRLAQASVPATATGALTEEGLRVGHWQQSE